MQVRIDRRMVVRGGLGVGAATVASVGPERFALTQTPVADGVVVDTAFGEVIVPNDIRSVVVIEGRRDLDLALSLDLPLAGYPEAEDVSATSPLAAALAKAEDARPLFAEDEPDLEAIIGVDPSLILSRDEELEELWDRLSAIAPVLPVGSTATGVRWQDDLQMVAAATRRQDRERELLDAFATRAAEVKASHADVWDKKVLPLSFSDENMQFLSTRLLSSTMTDLGVTFASSGAEVAADGGRVEYSHEQVQAAVGDADAIVILVNEDEVFAQWLADPLWQNVPAIQAGHYVRSDKHTHDGGPITAMHCLDVIDQMYETLKVS